ncbi:MAG: cation:proton antiporter, partial [Bdellovibrionota bacterium]
MHEIIPGLGDLLIVASVSIAVVILFHQLRQPAIAGFLISGALIGPFGLAWIADLERMKLFSEVGVILLMFSLGVEFSISKLSKVKKAFFGVGFSTCALIGSLSFGIFWILGFETKVSLVFGALASMSSTAIVLKILQQRKELLSPHGQVTVATLLFQDLWVIPLMLFLPILAATETFDVGELAQRSGIGVLKTIGIFIGVWLGSRYLVPLFLRLVAKTQMRELFVIAIFLLCLGTAFGTSLLGLSLALGAFLAGLMVSESDYGHQAVADIIPFRDIFIAIFFVSVGCMLDLNFLIKNFEVLLLISAGVLVLKFGVFATATSFFGYESRIAAMTGIFLAQIGEFSIVLADQSLKLDLIPLDYYQYFLSTTLVLMLVTPTLIQLAPKLAPRLSSLDLIPKSLKKEVATHLPKTNDHIEHVIIVGFGLNGRDLAEVLSHLKIPFIGIDINQKTVTEFLSRKVSIIFGDASRTEILEAANLETARMVVIAISDPTWVHSVISSIRRIRPEIHILVRAHYNQEVPQLERSGASDIVVGELETGLEIFARVLKQYDLKPSLIRECVESIHGNQYQQFRQILKDHHLSETLQGWMSTFGMIRHRIHKTSDWIGKSLSDLQLNERWSVLVAGVYRENLGYRMPDSKFVFEENDIVFIVSEGDQIEAIRKNLDSLDQDKENGQGI